MDQITIKTPNPKYFLFCCLIEFIDWLTSPPSLCEKAQGHVFKQSVTEGRGPLTDKHLPPNPFTGNFLSKDDL
jgi:hypothetical protein